MAWHGVARGMSKVAGQLVCSYKDTNKLFVEKDHHQFVERAYAPGTKRGAHSLQSVINSFSRCGLHQIFDETERERARGKNAFFKKKTHGSIGLNICFRWQQVMDMEGYLSCG